MFGQTLEIHDLAVIGLLIILEGVLSIDNALVLGLLAKRLPKHLQKRALTYGLVGAFVFRVIAIATAALLIQIRWIKLLGGLYLVYVAVKHLVFERGDEHPHPVAEPGQVPTVQGTAYQFWMAVLVIELTDIAFAVDSILAAVGLVAGRDKTWVVIIGGFLGVILMRFAATVFIKLLDRFPRFELAAYLLVLLIGIKLMVDWYFNPDPHAPTLDFHSPKSVVFWIFWGLMAGCFAVGFFPPRRRFAPDQART